MENKIKFIIPMIPLVLSAIFLLYLGGLLINIATKISFTDFVIITLTLVLFYATLSLLAFNYALVLKKEVKSQYDELKSELQTINDKIDVLGNEKDSLNEEKTLIDQLHIECKQYSKENSENLTTLGHKIDEFGDDVRSWLEGLGEMAAEVKSFKEFTNNVQSYVTKISRNSKLMTQGGELFFMATVASFIGFIMLYISFSVAKLNNFDLSLLNAINYLGLGLIIYGTINAIIGLVFKLFYVLSKNNPY